MGTAYNSEEEICSAYRKDPSKFMKDILKVHNRYRAIHNSPPLQIDEKVALFISAANYLSGNSTEFASFFFFKFTYARNFLQIQLHALFREKQCGGKIIILEIILSHYQYGCLKLCSWTSVLSSWRRVYRKMEKKLTYRTAKMCTSDILTGECFPKSRCNIGENFAQQILTCRWKVI